MAILMPKSELKLHTRNEHQIKNEICREPIYYGLLLQSEAHQKEYPSAKHRPVKPSRIYNCHGLTFASRRTFIWLSEEITKILDDDGYEKVDRQYVLAGDIVVYYATTGDAEHSGVVVEVDQFGPKILSKWGQSHEVVHREGDCPYNVPDVRFYRITT